MGVSRIVLGREVSLEEAFKIKTEVGLEVEMFIHGSMCMAYSGNCVISNYTQGRDSNRGGCAHSCRFEYQLESDLPDLIKSKKAFFMSSKDLNGINLIGDYIDKGISSVKIEGRMKGDHYAGTVTKAYKEAIQSYLTGDELLIQKKQKLGAGELEKVSHREYTEANLIHEAGADSIYKDRENEIVEFVVAGVIVEVVLDQFLLVAVRSHFSPTDEVQLIPFEGPSATLNLQFIKSFSGQSIKKTSPGTLVKIPYFKGAQEYNLLRKKIIEK